MLYRKYARNKFQVWKMKVNRRLPEIGIKILSKEKGEYHSENMKLFGRVLAAINDPYYSIQDRLENCNAESEMALQIILEIQVCELFKNNN